MMPVPLPLAGLAHKPSVLPQGDHSSRDHHLVSSPTMKLPKAWEWPQFITAWSSQEDALGILFII